MSAYICHVQIFPTFLTHPDEKSSIFLKFQHFTFFVYHGLINEAQLTALTASPFSVLKLETMGENWP